MADLLEVFAPLTKRERDAKTGVLTVHGKVTGTDLDLDGQRMDPDWLKTAVPAWFTSGANIREMHQPKAVGKGVELEQQGDDWYLTSKIIDRDAIEKVEHEVLTGYSIGIKNHQLRKSADAPNGVVCGGAIVENSLVDRPALPTAKFVLAKMAGADLVPTAEWVDEAELAKAADPDAGKRDVSTDERQRLASSGKALPDGSFPIASVGDLRNAIQAIGRAKDRAKAMAHIKRRAKALGRTDLLPDSWKDVEPDLAKFTSADIQGVIAAIAGLIVAEAQDLAKGDLGEAWDIRNLLGAIDALCTFWTHEAREGEVAPPGGENEMMTLAQLADLTKAATTPDADDQAKAQLKELRKALGIPSKTRLAELVGQSVSKAVSEAVGAAVEDARKQATAGLEGVKGELEQLKQMAAPGSPSRTRSQPDTVKAAEHDRLDAEARRYRALARAVTDPTAIRGYSELAAEREAELAKLAT